MVVYYMVKAWKTQCFCIPKSYYIFKLNKSHKNKNTWLYADIRIHT